MNIFSNIGITELILILLLALLVVGPERLPELAQKLGKTLRDFRQIYENLSSELGPELMSIQQTTQELRESVDSVRSIPQDMVQSLAQAADLDKPVQDLKDVTDSIGQLGQTVSETGDAIKEPIAATLTTARSSLDVSQPISVDETVPESTGGETEPAEDADRSISEDVSSEAEADEPAEQGQGPEETEVAELSDVTMTDEPAREAELDALLEQEDLPTPDKELEQTDE